MEKTGNVYKAMDNLIVAPQLQIIGLIVAGLCLSACIVAIFALRDEH